MPGTTTDERQLLGCSFCGKSQRDVTKLIAGPGVYICNECVDLCNDIISDEVGKPWFGDDLDARDEQQLIDLMVSVHQSHDGIDDTVKRVVGALRDRGVSWARIGEALGMTRQSAWERFSGEE